MKPDLLAQLPRSQREAMESAGYRVTRWAAARAVLQARVTKNRIAGVLGEFLAHWLPHRIVDEDTAEFWLSFGHNEERIQLTGGSPSMVNSLRERALLHLPGLRSFWSQELRQQHFAALRSLVPQAWLLDDTTVPNGAVIEGLNAVSWEQVRMTCKKWLVEDDAGLEHTDWKSALAGRGSVLSTQMSYLTKLKAQYLRNEHGQVVLHSIQEASS
ncbi:hypothetical protein [Prosthecobacter vanneervenii]|uniref:Uncharacterized protein n=1 Tax=Prosthecobacter vanneervenii TaxID=48466 RepID=A0A7W7YEK6_9BACT|nr:hypothetical protein [Prosthecobacter vanneervenii]MBB5034425.1 hypothetical protein [Prosthecobacter vanneervenii]